MNKLMSIFGAIIFASFIMTSCGGGSAEASGEATGDATPEAMAPEATPEAMAAGTPEAAAPVAVEAKASEEAKGK